MRPFGLLLAACLCTVLLYDRLAGRFPVVLAAAVDSSARQESRLEKLQHYQVASQLLDVALVKYHDLRKAELDQTISDVYATFRSKLSANLQATWDRMKSGAKDFKWRQTPGLSDEVIKQEEESRQVLDKQVKAFYASLMDPSTQQARDWGKQHEKRPGETEIRMEQEFVELLTHERDEARAALR